MLSLSAVRSSVGYLTGLGLLNFTPEQSRQRLSAAKSFNPQLKEEWLSIREFALMGMSPREIHEALIIDQQLDIPVHTLRQRIHAKAKRKEFKREDEMYERNVRKTVLSATDEEIKGRVRLWLNVRRVLVKQGNPLPTTRVKWRSLLGVGKVKAILEKERPGSLDSIPATLYEWKLLARLLAARSIIQQIGIKPSDSKQLNGLTKDIGRLSPERSDALRPCFGAIIKAIPLQNGFVIEIS